VTIIITEPGVHLDLPEDVYHADPVPETSLSHSGAKKLLDSPAKFRHDLDNPRPSTKALDLGRAAHAKVLGIGAPVVTVPADLCAKNGAWSTTDAKAWIAEQQAAGATVLKPAEVDVIDAMAARLLEHDVARALLAAGEPEVSLFGRDAETSVMLRARLDWRTRLRSGRPVIVDYKTSTTADPRRFGKVAHSLRYHTQDPWYRGLADDLFDEPHAFLFLVQEKEPPYLVSLVELDDDARALGAQLNREARRLYLECMTSGVWPGYAPVVHRVGLPPYAYRDLVADDEPADDTPTEGAAA
jgi:hypothetical protein